MFNIIKNIKLKKNTKIKIVSKLSSFLLDDTENKEVRQIIEIKGNGKFEFTSYNFNKDILRNIKGKLKKCNSLKMINDLKSILDEIEPYAIAKDSDSWQIEININGETFDYFGNFIKDNEYMYKENKNVSTYLKELINIEDLFLLDGINKNN